MFAIAVADGKGLCELHIHLIVSSFGLINKMLYMRAAVVVLPACLFSHHQDDHVIGSVTAV